MNAALAAGPKSGRSVRYAVRLLALGALVVAAGLAFAAWHRFRDVTVAPGWSHRVVAEGLPSVSALAIGPRGALFASLELNLGKGSIVRLDPDGARHTVVSGLTKPDGMLAYRGGIVYTQEEASRPVRWWRDERDEVLFAAGNAEGIAFDGRRFYAVEDEPTAARLIRFDPESGQIAVLRDALEVAEGVAVCPDGRLYYAEKKLATVKRLREDGRDEIVVRALKAPGFLACDELGLWITEDANFGARVLLLDPAGGLHVVASHLRSAQTLLPIGNRRYLLAEQGRNRILEITATETE